MQPDEFLRRLEALNVWKRNGERAPHKLLLLLLAFASCLRGEPRLIPYSAINRPLQELLREFGPPRKSFHSEYPFWRLQNDGIWELANAEGVETRAGNTDAKKMELLRRNVSGGFTEDVHKMLSADPNLVWAAIHQILDTTFPDSYHSDKLAATGIEDLLELIRRRKRDPQFREMVLMAYDYQCAVCGLDLRLEGRELGLEAAHIKWHQAGGPDTASNGLALCALHHKLLDRGAIGLTTDLRVQVSQLASGNTGFQSWVLPFHGESIREPQDRKSVPQTEFITWHTHEVFRSPARESRT